MGAGAEKEWKLRRHPHELINTDETFISISRFSRADCMGHLFFCVRLITPYKVVLTRDVRMFEVLDCRRWKHVCSGRERDGQRMPGINLGSRDLCALVVSRLQ